MRKGEKQSFASRVREELIRLPAGKPCCMLSEISALTQTSGHLAFRGGGWSNFAGYCRSARRDYFVPGFRYYYLGFRVALVPVQ